jgi:hypothetical protein
MGIFPQKLKKHTRLLALLALFLVLTHFYARHIPAFEGPDEHRHFAYITKLVQEGHLPDPKRDVDTVIRQQAAQSPLYYVSVALFLKLRNFPEWQVNPQPNPWWEQERSDRINDNLNHFLMSPTVNAMSHEQRQLAEVLNWTRLVSPLYGLLAICGIYWAGLALWPGQKSWALFAATCVALTPQLLQAFSMVSNDVAVIAFSTLTIAAALHLYTDYQNRRLLIFTGMMMGLAVLAKANGLALWPVPISALTLASWTREPLQLKTITAWRPLIFSLGLLIITAMLFGGWWVVRSWLLYDDPLGIEPHARQSWFLDEPRLLKLDFVLSRLAKGFRDMWINFGWGGIRPALWGYIVPLAIITLGLWGLNQKRPDRRVWLLLLVILLGITAYIQWLRWSNSTPGRLLFPYYSAFILLMTWGLRQFPRTRSWLAAALGGFAIILVPTTIDAAFGAPPLHTALPDNLQKIIVDFGGPRLLGYRLDEPIQPGAKSDITLCWQAPLGNKKLAVPYSFSLQILDATGTVMGKRKSLPGLGHYTLWQPGKIFCDQVQVRISSRLKPDETFQILVQLFDLETQSPLPAYTTDGTLRPDTIIGSSRASEP